MGTAEWNMEETDDDIEKVGADGEEEEGEEEEEGDGDG